MTPTAPAELPFTPPEAAREIGFSESLLRRYALIYKSLGGQIPTDNRGGRLYPPYVLEIFREVRERVKEGDKVKEAMMTLTANQHLEVPATTVLEASGSEALALLKRLVEQNQVLIEQNQVRDEQISNLENELRVLREQVSMALPASAKTGEVEQRIIELEKRNQALRAALEAKEREEQERQRPWWQLWTRRSTA